MSKVKIKLNPSKVSFRNYLVNGRNVDAEYIIPASTLIYLVICLLQQFPLWSKYAVNDLGVWCVALFPYPLIITIWWIINKVLTGSYLTNEINCSFCDKKLSVRYPKENKECPKCKTLYVIDWDKE
jgi:hypothetical protein